MSKGAMRSVVNSEEVKKFIQDNLTYINRSAGVLDYVDKNGNNMEQGFADDVYEGINAAIIKERKVKLTIY